MNWNNVVIFAAGAAIGSAVTWKLLKDKYAKIAQEEIDSVKEVFTVRKNSSNTIDELVESKEVKDETLRSFSDKIDYSNLVKEIGYISKDEEGGSDVNDKPYVIEPEEYGEMDGYETVSLTYYADGVLADDRDNVVEDVEGMVGVESLDHFGEYEDDSVFVRNDRLETDYEILLDLRNFDDVAGVNPNRVDYDA